MKTTKLLLFDLLKMLLRRKKYIEVCFNSFKDSFYLLLKVFIKIHSNLFLLYQTVFLAKAFISSLILK